MRKSEIRTELRVRQQKRGITKFGVGLSQRCSFVIIEQNRSLAKMINDCLSCGFPKLSGDLQSWQLRGLTSRRGAGDRHLNP